MLSNVIVTQQRRALTRLASLPNVQREISARMSRIIVTKKANSSTAIPEYRPPVTADRELPDPFEAKYRNRRYFLAYAIGVTLACFLIFNYEKLNSPIVNSVLYCLRRSDAVKSSLGDQISFKYAWPWIKGTLNTNKGHIDISFSVKGSSNTGTLYLKASRSSKHEPFDVLRFDLVVDDQQKSVIKLTDDESFDLDM